MTFAVDRRDGVDPVLGEGSTVVEAIRNRAPQIKHGWGQIGLDLGPDGSWPGGSWTVDENGSLTAESPASEPPMVRIVTSARVIARLLNGEMDPRHALLFGHLQVSGPLAPAVVWLDEISGRRHPRRPDYAGDVPTPAPTTDLGRARRQLRVHGYCIVADVLETGQFAGLKRRLMDQAAAERQAGVATFDGGTPPGDDGQGTRREWWMGEGSAEAVPRHQPNQRIWALQNKGDAFLALLDHPIIDAMVPDFLGDHFLIAETSANIAGPGGQRMMLHQDQSGVQPPLPVAIGLNLMFCLDDFTAENGATRVIPGSHLAENGLAPDDLYSPEGTVPTEAPAGSVVFFESRIWHGTGANVSDRPRHGLYLLFERSWMRTQHNGPLSVHPTVLARMSERAKVMYGHRVTGALGKVQSSREGDFVGWDPDQLILELHPRDGAR